MRASQDHRNAEKILDLYEKLNNREFIIGFTGHFSAGKSSMINQLMDTDILPNSPIPTSANIVKLTSGDGVARIFFHHENPIEYDEPYDFDAIKEYCKDKDTISKIELSTANQILPERCAIFDTPGIDAADETDRLITESSLHLIDMMFYVVDYNHVQSEVNLNFLRKIQEMNIPYFLIVNQIDKHNEEEIAFKTFEEKIKQTFDQWKLNPKSVYYTSLLDASAQYNQFAELKKTIFSFFNEEDRVPLFNIDAATLYILNEHKKTMEQQLEEEVQKSKVASNFNDFDEIRLMKLNDAIEMLNSKPDNITNEIKQDLTHTLDNAYLMPADLREKAQSFLESQQKNFKVGFIRSKKKTKIEQEARTDNFLTHLLEKVETNLTWKIRDKLHQLLKKYELEHTPLTQTVQQLEVTYTKKDLLLLTKQGAKVNADYILNYTKDVSNDIVRKYKQKLNPLFEDIHHAASLELASQRKAYESERSELRKALKHSNQIADLHHMLELKVAALERQLDQPDVSKEEIEELNNIISEQNQSITKADDLHKVSSGPTLHIEKMPDKNPEPTTGPSVHDTIKSIDHTINIIETMPGFDSMIAELSDKKKRLKNKDMTVVLFGAFSAGKSSFANALIGDRLLPTSPNPTTAVINRIKPVTDEFKHGTVSIQMKSEETLIQDLNTILRPVLGKSGNLPDHFPDMIEWINAKNIPSHERINKEHQAFLQALLDGFDKESHQLGEKVGIAIQDFANYVTDEAKACYIEEVTLYYDCELTRQGITLVDTPGSDSINARHTNVAFDFIKHADAILYVTYYNHALSKADKDFLEQLGRVKETFELDKMFFIINAADLANNDQELSLVENYVEDQLIQLGIRFPQIYPLSSKLAFEDKINGQINEQMEVFNENLFNFIHYDLAKVIIKSSVFEITRAQQTLEGYIETSKLDQLEKDRLHTELLEKQKQATHMIQAFDDNVYLQRLLQKVEKQLYYVEERLSIRFHDMFKEKFNPASVNEAGRKARGQLEKNLLELLDYAGYELLQEVRAVSLRVESFITELSQELDVELKTRLNKIEKKFAFSELSAADWHTPEYEQAFIELESNVFNDDLALFRGTKSFFEKNEKDLMKESIYETLIPHIKQYVKMSQDIMDQSYMSQWKIKMEERKQTLLEDLSSYIENSLALMSAGTDLNMMEEKQQELQIVLKNIK